VKRLRLCSPVLAGGVFLSDSRSRSPAEIRASVTGASRLVYNPKAAAASSSVIQPERPAELDIHRTQQRSSRAAGMGADAFLLAASGAVHGPAPELQANDSSLDAGRQRPDHEHSLRMKRTT